MLTAARYLRNLSLIRQCLSRTKNYGAHYSQRCDVDDCDCVIHQPKCKKRPQVVREVNCEKCIFECWEYKPRPKFVAPKTQEEQRKITRDCTPSMKDPKWRNVKEEKKKAKVCQHINREEAPVGNCPKTFKGVLSTTCKENPFKFEDEKVPLPDWDYNKKAQTPWKD
ncbi:uncharacterized protein LOC123314440 [Coccinella septempunctata]|uniref:uncharacterized protein LOC123314440 n=1 Tax=Coccinella septempunctata TaxID=41139 RepID=UPI001D06F935|nr:uncharacterized protein LOC123314440 [Coccinella septempunctata]